MSNVESKKVQLTGSAKRNVKKGKNKLTTWELAKRFQIGVGCVSAVYKLYEMWPWIMSVIERLF